MTYDHYKSRSKMQIVINAYIIQKKKSFCTVFVSVGSSNQALAYAAGVERGRGYLGARERVGRDLPP